MSLGNNIGGPDKGPIVNLANWTAVVAIVLLVALKILKRVIENVRVVTPWRLEVNDYFIFGSLGFSIAHAVLVSKEVDFGLGKGAILPNNVIDFETFDYAAQIIFIVQLFLSKLALLTFLMPFSKEIRNYFWGVVVLTATWAVGFVIVTALQCGISRPWDVFSNKCIDPRTLGISLGSVELLDEIAIIASSIYIAMNMSSSRYKTAIFVGVFSLRVLLLGLIAFRIEIITKSFTATDRLSKAWQVAVTTGVYMNINLLVSTAQCMLVVPVSSYRRSSSFVGVPPPDVENSLYAASKEFAVMDSVPEPMPRPQYRQPAWEDTFRRTSIESDGRSLYTPRRPPRPNSLVLPQELMLTVVKGDVVRPHTSGR